MPTITLLTLSYISNHSKFIGTTQAPTTPTQAPIALLFIVGDGTAFGYADAQALCVQGGGNLVKITTQQENEAAANMIPSEHVGWIGLNDIGQEGTFVWEADGSLLTAGTGFTSWVDSQPDNAGAGEHCVETWPPSGGENFARWNDNSCGVSRVTYGVCQATPTLSPTSIPTAAPEVAITFAPTSQVPTASPGNFKCLFTVDNIVSAVYLNDVNVTGAVLGDLTNLWVTKSLSLPAPTGNVVLAILGKELGTGASSFFESALQVECTGPTADWNFFSEPSTGWKALNSTSPTGSSFPDNWYTVAYDDSSWSEVVSSTGGGFGGSQPEKKIWIGGGYTSTYVAFR
jgi:hypothetical protein